MGFIISSLSLQNVQSLFCCIISIFNLILFILMVLFCGVIWRDSLSLSSTCLSLLVWDLACLSLEISIQLFFSPFLFSSYCCSVDPCVMCVVSGCLIDLSLIFFIKSSCRCINLSTLSSTLLSPLFLLFWHIVYQLRDVQLSSIFLSFALFVWVPPLFILKMALSIL